MATKITFPTYWTDLDILSEKMNSPLGPRIIVKNAPW